MREGKRRPERRSWSRLEMGGASGGLLSGLAVGGLSTVQYLFRPQFHVDARVINLGVVPGETRASKTVEVRNRSRRTLEIASLRTGCGSTEVALSAARIAPRSSALLTITQDGYRLIEGVSETRGFLFTNDP